MWACFCHDLARVKNEKFIFLHKQITMYYLKFQRIEVLQTLCKVVEILAFLLRILSTLTISKGD